MCIYKFVYIYMPTRTCICMYIYHVSHTYVYIYIYMNIYMSCVIHMPVTKLSANKVVAVCCSVFQCAAVCFR